MLDRRLIAAYAGHILGSSRLLLTARLGRNLIAVLAVLALPERPYILGAVCGGGQIVGSRRAVLGLVTVGVIGVAGFVVARRPGSSFDVEGARSGGDPGTKASTKISGKLRAILAELLGRPIDEIGIRARFTADLGGDSLDLVEYIMTVEEVYGIEVSDEAVGEFCTVEKTAEFVDQLKRSGGG